MPATDATAARMEENHTVVYTYFLPVTRPETCFGKFTVVFEVGNITWRGRNSVFGLPKLTGFLNFLFNGVAFKEPDTKVRSDIYDLSDSGMNKMFSRSFPRSVNLAVLATLLLNRNPRSGVTSANSTSVSSISNITR